MRNRVLITSVGRKVGLVRAFKEAGWYVIGHDNNEDSIAIKFCDEIAKQDEYSNVTTPLSLWVPTRDAEIKNVWNLNSYAYQINDKFLESIDTCLDKLAFYHWCNKNGFTTPEVYFVKPRYSQSRGTSPKEQVWEHIWQEPIEGEEYSIDLFADFDGNVVSIVPRLRLKTIGGESVVTRTVPLNSSIEESIELSKKLHLVGHNVLQMFMVGGVPYWTDINPRFGGASIVAIKAGCKSPEWLLKLVNGEKVEPCIGDYRVGLTGYSYSDWIFK